MNLLYSILAAAGVGALVLLAYLECVRRSYVLWVAEMGRISVPSAEANRSHNVTPAMLREPTCRCSQMIEPSQQSAYWRTPSAN